jgi:hypothetical protein
MLSIGEWSGVVEVWDKAFSMVSRHTDRQINRQTDTGTQTYGRADENGRTKRQTDRQTDG